VEKDMTSNDNNSQCDIGMIGLGVMGRNLALNMLDHGFVVAGFDKDKTKVTSLHDEANSDHAHGTDSLVDFIATLRSPRAILLLVPAGKAVDEVIAELTPHLNKGDLIIDAGNSHFTDTDRRTTELVKKGLLFLGIGISGGEEGARHGPSIMPGGDKNAYARVSKILEAVAAKADGEACVTYLGTGSSGHYVKMVHNGIEYGIMQLIAESYDLMKRGLGFNNQQLSETYQAWNEGDLNSYLIEITSKIFKKLDDKTQKPLIDEIVAIAQQNGTGMWTSESSLQLQLPVPCIDVAVMMRDLSVFTNERKSAAELYKRPMEHLSIDHTLFVTQLRNALYAAILMTYAQGMSLLTVASNTYTYHLNLASVAKIWRGGCIIRAKLLENICAAYQSNNQLSNLLLDPTLAKDLSSRQEHLRQMVSHASHLGVAAPGLMAALGYLDALRSEWSPANLIQAQRDFFGSHTYERNDMQGKFHTEWEKTI
jgi:6-phosphogluconate dehydrogenase